MPEAISTTCHPILANAGDSVKARKVRKRLTRQIRQAIDDFSMVQEGQRWMVCLSGGKDSYTLLALLLDLKWRGVLPVELVACNLDQGQPGFPQHVLPEFLKRHGVPHHIEYQDTYSIVTDKVAANRTYCSLCSRLRRGHLYRVARQLNCDAIALGHHSDDILETFFLNLFHGGQLAAMPPKLLNDDGDIQVLRPLAYSDEADIARFANDMRFPIIPCDLCGSQDGLQRQVIKSMLAQWEQTTSGRKRVMLKALTNVKPSHLMDRSLFDFAGLLNSKATKNDFETVGGDNSCDRIAALFSQSTRPTGASEASLTTQVPTNAVNPSKSDTA